ncbi:hypothetical protein AB5J72_28380 [Streptomyces sp. CG1]|uniref:hypothetical protein n=1 Tax=Streptomyces sp. CG1 TaxID=1287523 RepID=UPI0034E2DC53
MAAYDTNQAAALLGQDGVGRREYGDASLIVDQILSHLLGETQKIGVEGAKDDDASAQPREVLLREWARSEHLWMRMQHAERNAVLLGDTVYLLAWSRAQQRPVLKTIDPGFYFPVLADGALDAADYPHRVHLAWEVPEDPANAPGAHCGASRTNWAPSAVRTAPGPADTPDRSSRAPSPATSPTPNGTWTMSTRPTTSTPCRCAAPDSVRTPTGSCSTPMRRRRSR